MKFLVATSAVLTLLSVSASSAVAIETITVSATPIPVDDTGSSITVITREELQRRNAGIQSLLRSVPGFAVSQQGSIGAVTQLRVRGAEANQILVMINGIEVNDLSQGGEFDFSQIAINDIERIEIVRGPQSAIWGSDAMAGIVHIITTPEVRATQYSAYIESGSFATTRTTFSGNISSDKNQTKLSVDYLDSDGTNISRTGSEEDGLKNLTLSLSGRYTPSDSLDVTYTLRHTDKTTEFDRVDFFTTGLPVDADNTTDSNYLYGGISFSHLLNDVFDHSLAFSITESDSSTKPSSDEQSGIRQQLRYQLNATGESHRVSVRAERESEDFKQRGAASFFGDPNQNRDASTSSIAVEYRFDQDNLHLSLSGRHENNSEFDDSSSWRATTNFRFGETTVFASIGESIKNPTFTERYGFFTNFIGNPDLKPEESMQWEVGATRSFMDDRLDLSLTWFEADLENEINGFAFSPMTFGFTSTNVDDESDRQGAELTLSYIATERFSIKANYSYLDATQDDFSGNAITEVRRPEHTGSVSMDYSFNHVSVNLVVFRTGSQEDDYFPPFPPYQERVVLDGFTLVELSGQYRLNDHLTLTGRIENALDEDYEQVFGFESAGAAAYFGVRVNW